MKNLIALTLFIAFNFQIGRAQKAQFTLESRMNIDREDELIALSRQQLMKKIGRIGKNQFVNINYKLRPIVVQYDDLNGDGQWDELVFLKSFKAYEKIVIQAFVSNTPAAIKAVVRAHARHKRKNDDNSFGNDLLIDSIPAGQPGADFTKVKLPPFITEGPAWENDKVGFRIYFDVRNGKDIWGKTTARMMLDEVGANPLLNYHEQAEWGMDVLKVGASLGAGSLALQLKLQNGKDSLVRLGNVNMGKVVYAKVADGPVRTIIRLHYPEWKVLDNEAPVQLTEEISIWGGQYFYESKVTVSNAPQNAKLVTGIVNLKSKEVKMLSANGNRISYTFDQQSENHDELGMGIILSDRFFKQYITTPNANTDIKNTYAVSMNLDNKAAVSFRFYAGWSKSERQFQNQQGFAAFLSNQSKRISSPILIK
jgi:hypothetical protein